MLDKISDKDYHAFAGVISGLVFDYRTSNSEEDMAHNRESTKILDYLLAAAIPLVSVQPTLVTIGYLRMTFVRRDILENWPKLLEATNKAFLEKYKPEKVNQLLRGLDKHLNKG